VRKRIVFRVETKLFDFLRNFAYKEQTNVSEIVRQILYYFYYSCELGQLRMTLPQLEEEFRKKLSSNLKPQNTKSG